MFRLTKQVFIAILSFSRSLHNKNIVSNFTISISFNNQPCMTRPILIDLNPDKYNQGLRYYPFMVNLDRCRGSCNTFDDPSGRICVPNRTGKVNLNNKNSMMTRINESKH